MLIPKTCPWQVWTFSLFSYCQYSICGKTRGGVSNVFLTKPVGVNENLGGWEAPEGVKPPNPSTNRALVIARLHLCFRSKFYLNSLQYSGERPYRCTVDGCCKAFRQLSSLQQHLKGHNIPLPKSYPIAGHMSSSSAVITTNGSGNKVWLWLWNAVMTQLISWKVLEFI